MFTKLDLTNGTKRNAIASLILSAAAIAAAVLFFFFGNTVIAAPLVLWVLGVVNMMKGLHSDFPRAAKIARVLLVVCAALILVICVLSFWSALELVGVVGG